MEKAVMNLKDTAQYLNFKDEDLLRKKCKSKEIPCRKIGGEYRFSKTAIDMWLSGMDLEEIYKKVAEIQIENAIKLMA